MILKVRTQTCKRCGHTWLPRIEEPQKCPACKSYAWNRPRKESK